MTALHVVVDGACWSNPRGFGRFTREVVRAIARREEPGVRLTLVLEEASPWPVPDGVQVRTLALGSIAGQVAGTGARSLRHMAAMGRALHRERGDVVFFPAIYSWVPVPPTVPQVVTIHDTIPEAWPRLVFPTRWNRWLWGLKGVAARGLARRILTVSEASAGDLVTRFGLDRRRIDVTVEAAEPVFQPRAVDREALGRRWALDPRLPWLLYVGGFNAHKNVLRLIQAVRELPEPVGLILAGDTSGAGFHDNLPAIRAELALHPDLAARVAFPGWLTDDDLVDLYNSATCLALPSLAEGFGLPVAEAMACGCPVVCSDRTSLPEVAGGAAVLCDPFSVRDLSAALGRVISDVSLRESMREKGLARASELSWDAAAEQTLASLRRAVR